MPRSDQQIRQWIILKLLESRKKITLPQIARELDEPCHERTLRRDLDALCNSGFPVYTERQNGKTCWRLPDDYNRFPIPLTATEAYALQCGKQLLAPLEGTFITDSLQTLFKKISANLTPDNKKYFSLLGQTVQIGIPSYKIYKSYQDTIEKLKETIEQSKTVEIHYQPLRSSWPASRKVNPYRLYYVRDNLYLIGYCQQRKEVRTFLIDRIQSLDIKDQRFQIPLFFSIEDYFKDAFGVFRGTAVEVTLVFKKPASQWVQEKKWHASQRLKVLKGGKIQLDFNVAVTPEFTQWVLGFGAGVEVIKPVELRQTIENESWKILGVYQKIKSRKTFSKEKIKNKNF